MERAARIGGGGRYDSDIKKIFSKAHEYVGNGRILITFRQQRLVNLVSCSAQTLWDKGLYLCCTILYSITSYSKDT